jgi:hypothetical protein
VGLLSSTVQQLTRGHQAWLQRQQVQVLGLVEGPRSAPAPALALVPAVEAVLALLMVFPAPQLSEQIWKPTLEGNFAVADPLTRQVGD